MIVIYERQKPYKVIKIVTLFGIIPLFIKSSRVTL